MKTEQMSLITINMKPSISIANTISKEKVTLPHFAYDVMIYYITSKIFYLCKQYVLVMMEVQIPICISR